MIIDEKVVDGRSLESASLELVDRIRTLDSVAIAFSGGVDSSVVAAAAFRALGDKATAVLGVGPAVADSELQGAREVARKIGINFVELPTREIYDDQYVKNDGRRCYFCKTHLYAAVQAWATEHGVSRILSGTNADDLGDYRPGLEAAAEANVVAPLAELKIGKSLVRAIADYWGLEVAHKPASPCLASRIAYGQVVTIGRLNRIEEIESILHRLGFDDVRVRLHDDSLIRIEIASDQILHASEPTIRETIVTECRARGFQFVTLDLAGRETGSLNRLLENRRP